MNIKGELHNLWRAVDHEGKVPESFVTKTRNKKATLKFLKEAIRKLGQPEIIFTDGLRGTVRAIAPRCPSAPSLIKFGRDNWIC